MNAHDRPQLTRADRTWWSSTLLLCAAGTLGVAIGFGSRWLNTNERSGVAPREIVKKIEQEATVPLAAESAFPLADSPGIRVPNGHALIRGTCRTRILLKIPKNPEDDLHATTWEPVQAIRIEAHSEAEGVFSEPVGFATTDAEGKYSFSLPPGRYSLTASLPTGRHPPCRFRHVTGGGTAIDDSSTLELGTGSVTEVDFEIVR